MCADRPFAKKRYADIVDAVLDLKSGKGGRPVLSDAREGSVMRMLIEAFARELAVCYEQLDIVWRSGFLETAEGVALDNVVALLDLQRRRAGHLEGLAVFRRGEPAPEDIHIPAGTLVSGKKAARLFATVEAVVLARGERQVSAAIRATEPGSEDDPEKTAAGVLAVMPRPITGIEAVSNPSSLVLRQREETDPELRDRARRTVRGANTGTIAAIEQAVRAEGLTQVTVIESIGGVPGEIGVVIGDTDVPPDLLQRVRDVVEEVRPAGIWTRTQAATQILVEITATLEVRAGLSQVEKDAIRSAIETGLASYVNGLRIGESVRLAKVTSLLTGHEAVTAWHGTGSIPVIEPYVIDAVAPVSARFRYTLSNGDIRVGPMERASLDVDRLPIRIGFEADRTPVHLDIALVIDPANDPAAVERGATQSLNSALAGKDAEVREKGTASLIYEDLQVAIERTLTQKVGLGLRVTVLHQRDGMVRELQPGVAEVLAEREQPVLRRLTVKTGA